MVDEKSNLIVETRAAQMAGKGLSDNVIIEIVQRLFQSLCKLKNTDIRYVN